MKNIKKYNDFLLEHVSNDELYLFKYLNMSDEDKNIDIAYSHKYEFGDYLDHIGLSDFEDIIEDEGIISEYKLDKKSLEYLKGFINSDDDDDKDFYVESLISINKTIANSFGEYVLNNATDYSSEDLPTWYYLSSPKIIKKQWLIHETDEPYDIYKNGFTYGTDNMYNLGLTTYYNKESKEFGGYNFAYTLYDFERSGTTRNGNGQHNFKYGESIILFKCSGVKAYHIGDEEEQVMFWGNRAEDIIMVEYDDDKELWYIESRLNRKRLVEKNSVIEIAEWVDKHYAQYYKHLFKKVMQIQEIKISNRI